MMTCQVCGNTLEAWLCSDCSEDPLSAATRLLEKLEKKDEEIARLRGGLELLADEAHWKRKSLIYGAFTAAEMCKVAKEALE